MFPLQACLCILHVVFWCGINTFCVFQSCIWQVQSTVWMDLIAWKRLCRPALIIRNRYVKHIGFISQTWSWMTKPGLLKSLTFGLVLQCIRFSPYPLPDCWEFLETLQKYCSQLLRPGVLSCFLHVQFIVHTFLLPYVDTFMFAEWRWTKWWCAARWHHSQECCWSGAGSCGEPWCWTG